jgi:hypothetical protein
MILPTPLHMIKTTATGHAAARREDKETKKIRSANPIIVNDREEDERSHKVTTTKSKRRGPQINPACLFWMLSTL